MRTSRLVSCFFTILAVCISAQAQSSSFTTTVPATSDIWLAGADGLAYLYGDTIYNATPYFVQSIQVSNYVGGNLQFAATGWWSNDPNGVYSDPAGNGILSYSLSGSTNYGVGLCYCPANSLIGVFTDGTAFNNRVAPQTPAVYAGTQSVFKATLNIPFYIGTGTNISGRQITYMVPPNAKNFYFGMADIAATGNPGSATVQTTATFPLNIFLTNGLVAYYPFGGNANDASGNGNDGTFANGNFVADRFGLSSNAYSVSQLTDMIATPVAATAVLQYTFSGWFKTSSGGIIMGNSSTSPHFILDVQTEQTGGAAEDGNLLWGIQTGAGVSIIQETKKFYNDNQWHHVVGVFSASSGIITSSDFAIYVDGLLVTNTYTSDYNPPNAPFTQGAVRLTSDVTWLSFGATSTIAIDDVRIYNRALSPSEVSALYILESTPPAPTITTQPTDFTTDAFSPASFSVTASGANPLIYQWYQNGNPLTDGGVISGSTTSNLTFSSASAINAGVYTVLITNAYGSVTSSNCNLYVNKLTPCINTSPTASAIPYGQNVGSSILTGGSASVVGGFSFATPSDYPNAGSYLEGVTFTPSDIVDYNTAFTFVSLTVNQEVPVITTNPVATTITYGQVLTNSSLSGGAANVSGVFVFTTPTIAPHAGVTNISVIFTPTDTTNYANVATDITVTVNKALATVSLGNLSQVFDGTSKIPSVASVPNGLDVSLTYNDSLTSPQNAGNYLVIGNITDSDYFGSTTNTLTINKAVANVLFTNLNQTYTGNAITADGTSTPVGLNLILTYNNNSLTPPTNAGCYTVVGTVVESNYVGSATNTLFINKALATVSLGNLLQAYNGTASSVSETTTPVGLNVGITYNGSSAAPANIGSYTVVGTINDANFYGAITNTLVITGVIVTKQPVGMIALTGSKTNLSVVASGVPALKYQWRKNGVKLSGKTAATLAFNGLKTTDSGNYDVVINNSFGSVTSSVATVFAVTAPSISKQPKSVKAKTGQSVTFSVTATGTAPLNYQWNKNGNPINGATASSYNIASVQVADAATYTATISNIAGTVTSAAAALSVTVTP